MKRARAIISGRVQGVAFRYYAHEEASRLGVSGWARNLQDGRVEVVAEGPSEKVDALMDWCRRGPSSANVLDCTIAQEEPRGEEGPFQIRP